jgi:putative membrane protein
MMGMGTFGYGFNSSLNDNSMMGFSSGFGGGFIMILFWILIIIGIVALVKYTMAGTTKSERGKDAHDILKERYAKGEIDKDEFDAKKRDLE